MDVFTFYRVKLGVPQNETDNVKLVVERADRERTYSLRRQQHSRKCSNN
jgi:hypothetical protein